ncbi:MAG: hypothetical protein ACKVXR_02020 [Planctomycetota bacterium]
MSFPFVLINTLLVFAVAVAVCCWGFALIPIWRAKMTTITTVPFLLGLLAAGRDLAMGKSLLAAFVSFGLAAFLASMFLAFVYGWTKKSRFDSADVAAGIGRFGPVMVLWTCSLLYVAVVTLVNNTVTGSPIPFRSLAGP